MHTLHTSQRVVGGLVVLAALAALVAGLIALRSNALEAQTPATVTLQPGGNLVAYGGPPLLVEDALNDALTSVPSVFFFDVTAQQWQSWRRGFAFLSAFDTLVNGAIYWVVVEGTQNVTWTWPDPAPGLPQDASVDLVAGINVARYQGPLLPVEQALNDAATAVDAVWFFQPNANSFLAWNAALPPALRTPLALAPDQVYLLRATRAATWTFPAAGLTPAAAEFGDAPDGSDAGYPVIAGIGPVTGAFPSLEASNGARIINVDVDNLGVAATSEADANDPADSDGVQNLVNADGEDEGVTAFVITLLSIPPPAAMEVNITVDAAAPGGKRYLNALIDLNMDGEWGGVAAGGEAEWVVRNYSQTVTPGATVTFAPPAFAYGHGNSLPDGVWMRLVLTREPIAVADWDGAGIWAYGEVEDYRIDLPFGAAAAGGGGPGGGGPFKKARPVMSCPLNGSNFVNMGRAMIVPFACRIQNLWPGKADTVTYDMVFQRGNVIVMPQGVALGPVPIADAVFTAVPGLFPPAPTEVQVPFVAIRVPPGRASATYTYRADPPGPAFAVQGGVIWPEVVDQPPAPEDISGDDGIGISDGFYTDPRGDFVRSDTGSPFTADLRIDASGVAVGSITMGDISGPAFGAPGGFGCGGGGFATPTSGRWGDYAVICGDDPFDPNAFATPGPTSTAGAWHLITTRYDGTVPLDNAATNFTFSAVFDDGGSANNWVPVPDFPNDFFGGTDQWYQGTWHAQRGTWELTRTQVFPGNELQVLPTDARMRLDAGPEGTLVSWLVPANEVGTRTTVRTTSFRYNASSPFFGLDDNSAAGDLFPGLNEPLVPLNGGPLLVTGEFLTTITGVRDFGGHRGSTGDPPPSLNVTVGPAVADSFFDVFFDITISGSAPMVTVTGQLNLDGSVVATGSGTVAGYPGVRTDFVCGPPTINAGSGDDALTASPCTLTWGADGRLPGGQGIEFDLQLQHPPILDTDAFATVP